MANPKATRGFGLLEGFLAKKRAQKANSLIPQSYRCGRILDIGAGAYPVFLLSTAFSEKFGIDKTFSAMWQTELKDHSLALMHHDIEIEVSLPFQDEYFDVVTMLAVLEHMSHQNLPRISQELNRILKHGGLLIITTPAEWTGFILNGMAFLRLISNQEIRDHKGLHTEDSIIKTLQQGGFAPENVQFGYFEFFMNMWVAVTK
jgi:SAM-dependent methyltransferase